MNNKPKWLEVIILSEDICLGDKRQKLLEMAKGDYVAFLDDDDEPTKKYLEEFKKGIDLKVDVVCIGKDRYVDGEFVGTDRFGFLNPYEGEKTGAGHFCAVKRKLALKSGYRSIGRGEDLDHILGLQEHLKNAFYIEPCTLIQRYKQRKKEYDRYPSFFDIEPRILRNSSNEV